MTSVRQTAAILFRYAYIIKVKSMFISRYIISKLHRQKDFNMIFKQNGIKTAHYEKDFMNVVYLSRNSKEFSKY